MWGAPGETDEPKAITAYCEPWSLRAGETVVLRASSHRPGPAEVAVERISCGDPTRWGPGWSVTPVAVAGLEPTVELAHQPLVPGSYGTVELSGMTSESVVELAFSLYFTRPREAQTVLVLVGAPASLVVEAEAGGRLTARVGDDGPALVLRPRPLENRRWYDVAITWDLAAGTLTGAATTELSRSPGRDLLEANPNPATGSAAAGPQTWSRLVLAGGPAVDGAGATTGPDRGGLDGRIARPRLRLDDTELAWDLSRGMDSPSIVDTGPAGRHGVLHQLPTRAVTGPTWDGSTQRWTDDPSMWDAVHFHTDDLYDAGWEPTVTLPLPSDLPSGIYAFHLISKNGDEDRVPFFVRPAAGAPTADVALLMSSATYLAYANHRMLFDGADFIQSRQRLRPEHDYVRRHPEVGRSMYEKHVDGSGMMFSSRLRPVLNLRPGADGWNFTPDTDLNAWLEHAGGQLGTGHDVIGDEDVHRDGVAALAPYRVIVTCSHPEYWSTAMLDALEAWQRAGGRLMYLGGNGFYWRVAFSDSWPGAMELRRAEDGVRNWQTGNGESYHAWGGEYGGMWRRLERAPNEICGVGFAAQGFEGATYYTIDSESRAGRAAWVWDGVHDDEGRIGTSGLGGGAAGQELDRYDPRLGSPRHAVVLASAMGTFGPDMVRTKEEFEGSVIYPTPDPYVRSDIVFYETPSGGAVFSVGSISWFGALARNGYDNDVAQLSLNVLTRFLDPAPFPLPEE